MSHATTAISSPTDQSTRDERWAPAIALAWREITRFSRQRSRIIGALGTPVVFWLLIGSGLGRSFQPAGATTDVGYLEYFFPGTILLVVMFTAIFCMISVIEDRREGFMQAVLASPSERFAIVFGKVCGSTVLATVQGLLFLLLAPLSGVPLTPLGFVALAGLLVLIAVGLSAMGLLMAWPLDSTQGFHAVMNLLLMPMWFLSGALFPASGAASWIAWLVYLNPLTYGLAAVRRTMYGQQAEEIAGAMPSLGFSMGVSAAFAVVMLFLAVRVVGRRA
ncbi:MAG: ABC transporter permease [Phycisphaerae bacterium]